MNHATPERLDVLAAQNRLFVPAAIAAATLVTIEWLPKSVPDLIRLGYTLVYLGGVLLLLYQCNMPLKQYLQTLYAWRFAGAPEPIERATKSLIFSVHYLIAVPSSILLAFFGSVTMLMLALWFPDLNVLVPVCNLVWWVSLIAFALFPFAGGFLFQEVTQKYRSLAHEVELSKIFTPRRFADLCDRATDAAPGGVEIGDELRFRAANFDWHWNDFVQNCVVFGQIGSGKTSCVLNSVLDGLLGSAARCGLPPSGLILDPKGTFQADITALCHRYGRIQDLLVLDPDQADSVRWNPFDSADDEYELASRFAAVSRSLGTKDSSSSFWLTKSTMFIQNALELIRLTNPPENPPSFAQIYELANGFQQLAERTDRLDRADPRSRGCLDFFLNEWGPMASETRSSVQAHLTGMLFPFLKPPYATTFAGPSTMRISRLIDEGKLLYLHMPTSDRETMARTIGIFLKLEFYREILKRPRKKRPSFFFCDEFQKFFTAGAREDREQEKSDADTFRLSRESLHANIVATQNIGALGDVDSARTFLGNCMTAIFLRNPDEDTNRYAAQLFSQQLMGLGGSAHAAGNGRIRPLGPQQLSTHDGLFDCCPPHRFRELAICSADQQVPYCESLVFLGARGESPIPVRKLKWKRHPLSI